MSQFAKNDDDLTLYDRFKADHRQWYKLPMYHGRTNDELLLIYGKLPTVSALYFRNGQWRLQLKLANLKSVQYLSFLDALHKYQGYLICQLNKIAENKDETICDRNCWNKFVSFAVSVGRKYVCFTKIVAT